MMGFMGIAGRVTTIATPLQRLVGAVTGASHAIVPNTIEAL